MTLQRLNVQSEHYFCMFVISSQIEVDNEYQSQTCGLCGNFDGVSNEFMKDGKVLFNIKGIERIDVMLSLNPGKPHVPA